MEEAKEQKKKYTDIYSAINNLPDELITDDIWMAGIEEGNLKILNILTDKYKTEENIDKVIQKSEEKGGYYGFNLLNIPVDTRSQRICDTAFKKDSSNYRHVPQDKRTTEMLYGLLVSAKSYMHFLPLVPVHCWNTEAAYDGIRSLYSAHSSGNRSDNWNEIRMIQILLYYVPAQIKTADFFIGLFQSSMKVADIDFLTPARFKTREYYLAMARKKITAVPIEKLDHYLLTQAMLSDKNEESYFWGDWQNKNTEVRNLMFELMDDGMVDIILQRWPEKLRDLPQKYHTKKRLLAALAACKQSGRVNNVYSFFDVSKFDTDICKAIIKHQQYDCPKFAPKIWTPDFIDYCVENATQYHWFSSMPKELQTHQIVDIVIKESIFNIRDVRADLITYDMAVKAYLVVDDWNGSHKLEEYVPIHYFNDFVMETGLPKEFFGAETTYPDLKDNHRKHTYVAIGDCYIGFYADKDGYNTYNRLIMTRRTPMQIKPSIVFNRTVGTFHKTWLEKMVSDNDPQFFKPEIAKGMKGKQLNLYMGVRLLETYNDVKIYAHSFLSETVCYTAGYIQYNTLEKARQDITEAINTEDQVKVVDVAC